ncbi:hypothetical protein B5M42_007410 [Paenibacillus athensensis]|uniref:hypothetical protein n=1 Tax=Paenibacillus athensensis TaxID=1967502 RepID=UPI0014318DE7|nr:hypothetical protein [Paenibacillus athensensis]MCD1258660.1 hypothetical protein [Paenibacillus athensensis]
MSNNVNSSNNVVDHGLNAAQANAEDSKSKKQVDELTSKLKNTSTTSQTDVTNVQK